MNNYFKLALNRKQQALAKRLARLPNEEERLYDPELQNLDEKNSNAANVVMAYAAKLAQQEDR